MLNLNVGKKPPKKVTENKAKGKIIDKENNPIYLFKKNLVRYVKCCQLYY